MSDIDMKRKRTDLLMKRKDHSEKEKALLKKIKTEHSLFRCKMLLCPAEELYNSCRMICFYECLYEYFRYCEKINVDFIHGEPSAYRILQSFLWKKCFGGSTRKERVLKRQSVE